MNGLDPYLGLAKEVRDKIQIIIDDAEEGGGLGCLINCTDPDERPVVAEALDHVFNYLKIAARLMESAVKCIEECEGIETETETATFSQATVRQLMEIVSAHARNLGCGGTCLDDVCRHAGTCDIGAIMETLQRHITATPKQQPGP